MRTGRVIAALMAPFIALGLTGAAPAPRAEAPANGFARQLLAEHNAERDRAGVPRLAWSGKLASDAQRWAELLAREGGMRHSSNEQRPGAGENLWMGSAGYFGARDMIGAFVSEKRHYVHAAFPKVSSTGKWEDVGHYTQVVWRDTKEVGCAVARNARDDFLVCRYWPAGNWIGQVAY
ncbi:MAG TPA: CAP domain-containing protein [Croceibacterium sp.]|nr:CAP domain-containing protein [Croceibacterium sp.]